MSWKKNGGNHFGDFESGAIMLYLANKFPFTLSTTGLVTSIRNTLMAIFPSQ